jgi:hypothetical protein
VSDELVHGGFVYDDDGDLLGLSLQTLQGGWSVVDPESGTVLAAVDAAGQVDDVNLYEPVDLSGLVGGDEDDRAGEIAAAVDDLSARMDEAEQERAWQAQAGAQSYVADHDAGEQAWAARTHRELSELERVAGRPLSETEAWQLLEHARADFDAGLEGASIFRSAEQVGLNNTDSHEGRVAYAVERLADHERAQAGEPYDPAPANAGESFGVYDVSTHEGRRDKALDLLSGAADRETAAMNTYDSRDPDPEEQD